MKEFVGRNGMPLWRELCVFALIIFLVSLLFGFFPSTALAQNLPVHNVNTGYSYSSIHEAIADNATLNGHVIQVDAGVYYENVVLSKAVSLVGENSETTIVDGQGNGTVIDIMAPGVTVSEFTIRNSSSVSGSSGVHAYRSDFCNVSGNIFQGNYYGIWIQSSNNSIVSNNTFTANSNALYLDSSVDGYISGNTFLKNNFAVWFGDAESIDFHLNNVSGNDYAVWITQCFNVSLSGNWVVDNIDGVLVYNDSDLVSITGNTIYSNREYAVFLNGCSNSTVAGNSIASAERESVYVQNSQDNNITGNTVSSNGLDGVYLNRADANVVDNNFVNGSKSAITIYFSGGNVVSANELSRNKVGIVLTGSEGNRVLQNRVSESDYGIEVSGSNNNTIESNDFDGNAYGGIDVTVSSLNRFSNNHFLNCTTAMMLQNSSDNQIVDNDAHSCADGLQIQESQGNDVSGNTFSENSHHGIFLSFSGNNTLSSNVVLNNPVGLLLSTSNNNTLAENDVLENDVGLILNVSDENRISNNTLFENIDGIRLSEANNNTLELNVVSSGLGRGIGVSFSSLNVFVHNSFFNNSLVPASVNSSNSWDDGMEGNFWGQEGMVDANRDGIADAPYSLGDGEQDRFPLMGEYTQLVALMEDREYVVGVVCNSSVSGFRYFRDPENLTSIVSFVVGPFEGLGFCRVSIHRALVQPPFDVTVDNVAPLYQNIISTNATYSWLYFSFPYVGGSVRIANAAPAPPFWAEFWFWGIVALALVVTVLSVSVSVFYKRLTAYRKTVEEVERKLREREYSPLEVARRHFSSDVERRSVKIGKFEEKYGIKIRPKESLDDIFRGLEHRQKEKKKDDEVNS